MGDARRWNVTYTKHIKQKRKVYQDGFLELHSSSNKVMLYDDCEKLIDTKFEKRETVNSGETITFGSYLIDIGDPYGVHKPIPKVNIQENNKNLNIKTNSLYKPTFKSSFVSPVNVKTKYGENKAPSSSFNPSQRIIREFKNKYNASPSIPVPDTEKSKPMEWEIMYTTHLTQKAKKFHDGFLQLVISGAHGKQIKLYNETKELLSSRFLKKDELIKSGESIKFDGYLVEIGECEGDIKEVKIEKINQNVIGKTEILQNSAHTCTTGEWDVMYTNQTTQKAKKYNCGILKIVPSGSYRMQATLVSEDGDTLCHNFLKLSEDVKTGITLRLKNYLVEINEQRKCIKGEGENSNFSSIDVESITNSVKKFQDYDSPKKKISNTRSFIDCDGENVGPTNTPIRAARDILSFIKKPKIVENIVKVENNHVKLDEETVKKSNITQTKADEKVTRGNISQTKADEKVPGGNTLKKVKLENDANKKEINEGWFVLEEINPKQDHIIMEKKKIIDEFPSFDLGF